MGFFLFGGIFSSECGGVCYFVSLTIIMQDFNQDTEKAQSLIIG